MAFVCTRGRTRRCRCGRPATALCDYPLAGRKKGTTCNTALCASCSARWDTSLPVQPSPDYRAKHGELDLCLAHHRIVLAGNGPGFFLLIGELSITSPGSRLASKLMALTITDRAIELIASAEAGEARVARGDLPSATVRRLRVMSTAMRELAASYTTIGAEVWSAEHRCIEILTNGKTKATAPWPKH